MAANVKVAHHNGDRVKFYQHLAVHEDGLFNLFELKNIRWPIICSDNGFNRVAYLSI
jgi:hypothetical protein